MSPTYKSNPQTSDSVQANPFQPRSAEDAARAAAPQLHVFGNKVVCETDTRGFPTPGNLGPEEIVLDASEGFIPLWDRDTTLRWRFQEQSLTFFAAPDAAKAAIRDLMGKALLAWDDAVPVKFAERDDAWDFEIVIRSTDNCSLNGCVLASAFFPDNGRHELVIYPKMLTQSVKEQVDTLVHELGHVFGLRHFFANISETAWPSVIFGDHEPFSIMNYGHQSELTDADRSDLKQVYEAVWAGDLTEINGTPIKLVKPFHTL